MAVYNKAVRDKIPEIIKNSGSRCKIRKLSDGDFLVELGKKLGEEVGEYLQSGSVEELVDVLEVTYRIAELKGTRKNRLELLRKKKRGTNGEDFQRTFFLLVRRGRIIFQGLDDQSYKK